MKKADIGDDNKDVDLHAMWDDDSDSAPALPVAAIHKRARRRQLMGDVDFYGGCVFLVALLSIVGWGTLRVSDGFVRLSLFMMATGGAFIVAFYAYHRRVDKRISSRSSAACVPYYKAYLERRIWLMRYAWAWMLAPMLPGVGLGLYAVNRLIQHPVAGAKLSSANATLMVHGCEAVVVLTFLGLLLYWNVKLRARRRELKAISGLITPDQPLNFAT